MRNGGWVLAALLSIAGCDPLPARVELDQGGAGGATDMAVVDMHADMDVGVEDMGAGGGVPPCVLGESSLPCTLGGAR